MLIYIITGYALGMTLLFIYVANKHVNSVRSEAILFNALKYQNLKYNDLREIFVRFEATNQIKPLKRDIEHFFKVTEKDYNKKLVQENEQWRR